MVGGTGAFPPPPPPGFYFLFFTFIFFMFLSLFIYLLLLLLYIYFLNIIIIIRSSGGMTLCLHDGLCVCVSVLSAFWYTLFYILVYTFLSVYILFNTATDQVHFWHACTLGQGLYSPNVFGDAALINYANLCNLVKIT